MHSGEATATSGTHVAARSDTGPSVAPLIGSRGWARLSDRGFAGWAGPLPAMAPQRATEAVAFAPPRVPSVRVFLGGRFPVPLAPTTEMEYVLPPFGGARQTHLPRSSGGSVCLADDPAPFAGEFVDRPRALLHLLERLHLSPKSCDHVFAKRSVPFLLFVRQRGEAAPIAVHRVVAREEPDAPAAVGADAERAAAVGALEAIFIAGRAAARGTAVLGRRHRASARSGGASGSTRQDSILVTPMGGIYRTPGRPERTSFPDVPSRPRQPQETAPRWDSGSAR